jgi:hypothetical protein
MHNAIKEYGNIIPIKRMKKMEKLPKKETNGKVLFESWTFQHIKMKNKIQNVLLGSENRRFDEFSSAYHPATISWCNWRSIILDF